MTFPALLASGARRGTPLLGPGRQEVSRLGVTEEPTDGSESTAYQGTLASCPHRPYGSSPTDHQMSCGDPDAVASDIERHQGGE